MAREIHTPLRYDRMVDRALRGVIREALLFLQAGGGNEDTPIYLTFHSTAPGVVLPDYVRARNPVEMTIIFQNYVELTVTEDGFAVTLSFTGTPERLQVPFAAVSGFADPSAKFGLQFQTIDGDDGDGADDQAEDEATSPPEPAAGEGEGNVVTLDAWRKK